MASAAELAARDYGNGIPRWSPYRLGVSADELKHEHPENVVGGRLQLYQSVPFSRYQIVREERRREARGRRGRGADAR